MKRFVNCPMCPTYGSLPPPRSAPILFLKRLSPPQASLSPLQSSPLLPQSSSVVPTPPSVLLSRPHSSLSPPQSPSVLSPQSSLLPEHGSSSPLQDLLFTPSVWWQKKSTFC
uniref:Uncharacterized protein n=1 Tax=Knipowitschia caucasica TaxID=637954 RepID=A0AAV2JYR1_KNICA